LRVVSLDPNFDAPEDNNGDIKQDTWVTPKIHSLASFSCQPGPAVNCIPILTLQ